MRVGGKLKITFAQRRYVVTVITISEHGINSMGRALDAPDTEERSMFFLWSGIEKISVVQ